MHNTEIDIYDENGNYIKKIKKSWKPLKENLKNLDKKLYWIILMANNIYTNERINKFSTNENIPQLSDYKQTTLFIDYINDKYQNKNKKIFDNNINTLNSFYDIKEYNKDIIYTHNVYDNYDVLEEVNNINKDPKEQKYIFQRYNNYNNENKNDAFINTEINLNNIITLPYPASIFSKINLPDTTMLDRISLHSNFLNYWEIFTNKREFEQIDIDDNYNDTSVDKVVFFSNILKYKYTGSVENYDYDSFLDVLIPDTRTIFNKIKSFITGNLSLQNILYFLEPFLIYAKDISFMTYTDIAVYIQTQVSYYIENFIIKKSRSFKILSKLDKQSTIKSDSLKIYNTIKDKSFWDYYDTYKHFNIQKTLSNEVLKEIILLDYGKFYNIYILLQNNALVVSNNLSQHIEQILNGEKKDINKSILGERETSNTKCENNYIIAKRYTNIDDLKNDNGKQIYFDKDYDKTPYYVVDAFKEEQSSLTQEEFKIFLESELKKDKIYGAYNQNDFETMLNSLLIGRKKINDGDYSIFINGDKYFFFKRENNNWMRDEEVPEDLKDICNFKDDCISNTLDECQSLNLVDKNMKNNIINEIYMRFDKEFEISTSTYYNQLVLKYNYLKQNILRLNFIRNQEFLKYNNIQFDISNKYTIIQNIENPSPYIPIRNKIMGIQDFVKRQTNILLFCKKCVRVAVGNDEKDYWLYCVKTDTKLLPSFVYILAKTFIENPDNYEYVISQVIKDYGEAQDDGWYDKNSGWKIKDIDFEEEVEYDNAGFKINNNDIIDADFTIDATTVNNKTNISTMSKDAKLILIIVNSLSAFLKIDLSANTDFIVKTIIEILNTRIISKLEYEAKNNKISYEKYYYTHLLYLTLGLYLIVIQTNIPSIKPKVSSHNCIPSFEGYPVFKGNEVVGDAGIKYITCLVSNISNQNEPWNILPQLNFKNEEKKEINRQKRLDKIEGLIRVMIDGFLLDNTEIQFKINEKMDYLQINITDEIPDEYDVTKWTSFLPPLKLIYIEHLKEVQTSFLKQINIDIRTGEFRQYIDILILLSKSKIYSLSIQEDIQNIVLNEKLILFNSSDVPFMENSCCNDNSITEMKNIISYFEENNKMITSKINTVVNLSSKLLDISNLSIAELFYCTIKTKMVYPQINLNYSLNIIYGAFIVFCKFNSDIPIYGEITNICKNKPDYINKNDTIEEQILQLQKHGVEYNNKMFLELIKIVGSNNIIHINKNNFELNLIEPLQTAIENINDNNNYNDKMTSNTKEKKINEEEEQIFDNLTTLLKNCIETKDNKNLIRQLNNYLQTNIEKMKIYILEFLSTSQSKKVKTNIKNFLDNLIIWANNNDNHNNNLKISNDDQYNCFNFLKEYVMNFAVIFPNIIINSVPFNDVKMHSYLKLSTFHENTISTNIKKYYEDLNKYYNDNSLETLLDIVTKKLKNVVLLSNNILSTLSNEYMGINIDSEKENINSYGINKRTSSYIYEFIIMYIFYTYISLTSNEYVISSYYKKQLDDENEGLEKINTFALDYIDDLQDKTDISFDLEVIKDIKEKMIMSVRGLLITYIGMMNEHKNIINVSYTDLMDKLLKSKNFEKNQITDRLKLKTDEERKVDNNLKINKLGDWGKGLEKGLRIYDKETNLKQFEEFNTIIGIENKMKEQFRNIGNIDLEVDEIIRDHNISQNEINTEIDITNLLDPDYYDNYENEDGDNDDRADYD